jgi:hypothetical protein
MATPGPTHDKAVGVVLCHPGPEDDAAAVAKALALPPLTPEGATRAGRLIALAAEEAASAGRHQVTGE